MFYNLPGRVQTTYHVGNNIPMAQHNTFWKSRGPTAVDQKCDILIRGNLRAPPFHRCTRVENIPPMFETRALLVPQQDNSVPRNPRSISCLDGCWQEVGQGYQSFSARVLQLECQLFDGVCWICRCDDSARPQGSPSYGRCVDLVGTG